MSAVREVVILCGGRGTRLQERTREIPKPLVEIGGRPILWHVMQIYLAQGFESFVLCTGYRAEMIEDFVAAEPWPESAEVSCVRTGEETPTGGRIHLVRDRLDGRTFCATYSDGVADIDLGALVRSHAESGRTATMTVVQPQLQFGVTELGDNGEVRGFKEKPRSEHWINGGFFCFEPDVFDYLSEKSVLERDPLERLAAEGRLNGYRHTGFWECMDTYKDSVQLNDLWAGPRPPWKVWN